MIEAGKNIGTGRPSLAQDLLKGRATEVEHLNGYVVRKGQQVGVPTPVNQAIVDLTRRVDSGEIEASLSNLALVDAWRLAAIGTKTEGALAVIHATGDLCTTVIPAEAGIQGRGASLDCVA